MLLPFLVIHYAGSIVSWITIVAGAFAAFWALRLINPKYYDGILEVWAVKWNRETPENERIA